MLAEIVGLSYNKESRCIKLSNIIYNVIYIVWKLCQIDMTIILTI